MVQHKDEKSDSHDGTHDYQEEKDSFAHEQVLKGQHSISFDDLSSHVELHRIEVDPLKVGQKR
jgi:hypothetical protein